jgi:hypothetical protein
MTNLAGDLFDEHQSSEAEKLDRQALEIDRHALGADHPRTLALMDDLALVLDAEGQLWGSRKARTGRLRNWAARSEFRSSGEHSFDGGFG